jgi:hypothetical protein
MNVHSHIGASSAYRWWSCPGSVRLIRQAPPQEQSEYAAEGTAAHEIASLCLSNKTRPEQYLGTVTKNGFDVTDEMVEAINVYLDAIDDLTKNGTYIRLVEVQFDLGCIYEGLFGTADFIAISSDMKRIIGLDFKYGAGVPVEAKENKQLLYYLLGAINFAYSVRKMLDDPALFGWQQTFEEVQIGIVQPRCRHKEGAVRMWPVPKGYLDSFADELRLAAELTEDPKANLCVGTWCKFCPAMSICPAFNQQVTDIAKADFSVEPVHAKLLSPDAMTLEQIAKVLAFSDLISDWLKSVEAHALLLAEHGDKVPGFKLVKKKANRKWIGTDDEIAEKLGLFLSDEKIWQKKLLSPAQVEKLVKGKEKKLIEDLFETPDNGNTLAPDHDKRPEVAGSVETDFPSLNS